MMDHFSFILYTELRNHTISLQPFLGGIAPGQLSSTQLISWWFLMIFVVQRSYPALAHTAQNGNRKTGRFFPNMKLGTHWAPWSCHSFWSILNCIWIPINGWKFMAIQDMTKGKTSCTYKEKYVFIKNTERKENTTARCVIYIYKYYVYHISFTSNSKLPIHRKLQAI